MLPPDSPVFSKIAIVGLGLIGGSVAFGAKRAWPSTYVVAIDRQPVEERDHLGFGGHPAHLDRGCHGGEAGPRGPPDPLHSSNPLTGLVRPDGQPVHDPLATADFLQ